MIFRHQNLGASKRNWARIYFTGFLLLLIVNIFKKYIFLKKKHMFLLIFLISLILYFYFFSNNEILSFQCKRNICVLGIVSIYKKLYIYSMSIHMCVCIFIYNLRVLVPKLLLVLLQRNWNYFCTNLMLTIKLLNKVSHIFTALFVFRKYSNVEM